MCCRCKASCKGSLLFYVESTILELDKIYINGGYQGFCLEMKPDVLVNLLHPTPVNVAIDSLD